MCFRTLAGRLVCLFFWLSNPVTGQDVISNVPYTETPHARHVLDVYVPGSSVEKSLPVVFWIHGGGWQAGDKSDVALKPKVLTDRGFVFVSTNYRLLPEVSMEELIGDVAKSVAWVHRNIAKHGGDPNRIIIGGHSAGAQLAALLCTDSKYLADLDVPLTSLRGCVPVDGDTYDIPKIIATAEHRQTLYGGKMFTFGHRQKFGNDPEKHVQFSAVTHVAKGKYIPPFLLLYFSGNPDTVAQAQRLESALRDAGIDARSIGKGNTNHSQLNDELGKPDDPATLEFLGFLERVRE